MNHSSRYRPRASGATLREISDQVTPETGRSAPLTLAQARDLVLSFDRGEGSPVDELILERRTEAS
jgi:hypothetical protein